MVGANPAVVTGGDGTQRTYNLVSGGYVAPAGIYEDLVHNVSGSWTLKFKGGSAYNFVSAGTLVSQVDNNGNATTLSYSGGNLTTVTDSASRSLTIGYTGGKPSSVTDCEGRVWGLAYNAGGRPSTVSAPTLGGTTYTTAFVYNSNGDVSAETDRLNKTWSFSLRRTGCSPR